MEIFKLTEKAESKYRPVATISQIEIASHDLVVLVGECLPQTLLYTLRVIPGCAVFVYITPRRSCPDDKEVQCPRQKTVRNRTPFRKTVRRGKHSSSSSESPQKKSGNWKSCARFSMSTSPLSSVVPCAVSPSSKPLLSPAAEKMH